MYHRDATNFPKPGQTVRVHYVASLADGSQFDSSRARDQPVVFRLGSGTVRTVFKHHETDTVKAVCTMLTFVYLRCSQVLPGLEAGVLTMSRGQVAKITIPPGAGYGVQGFPPIVPPNAILNYEVELISFANVEEGVSK